MTNEATVNLPLPCRIPLTFPMPGRDPVEIGEAMMHLSSDGSRLLFTAVLRGLGRVEGELPIPVVERG
jgi:hypothetical protein